jgi:hypothetical protein
MLQVKFSLDKPQHRFIEQYKELGFKDKSQMVRVALDRLNAELEQQRRHESGAFYAEVPDHDAEIREWSHGVPNPCTAQTLNRSDHDEDVEYFDSLAEMKASWSEP